MIADFSHGDCLRMFLSLSAFAFICGFSAEMVICDWLIVADKVLSLRLVAE